MNTAPSETPNPHCAEIWASAYDHQARLNYYFPGLKMQIQEINNAIVNAGFADSQARALCDIAQQIVVTMETINNEPLVPNGPTPPMPA